MTLGGDGRAADGDDLPLVPPYMEIIDRAVKRARGWHIHALVRGDFGGAITAELLWRDQRPRLLWRMELGSRSQEAAEVEMRQMEMACDARCREIMDREPELTLDGLLDRIGASAREAPRPTWVARHLHIKRPA